MSTKVTDVIPFLWVSNMEASLRYYVDGLGFTRTNQWVVNGAIRWCRLALGGAALMLQERKKKPETRSGEGVSLYIQCEDALTIYRLLGSRGIAASEPEVGNGMWVTTLFDPDGYQLHFTSATDTPEDTKLSEL